ncbi:hypothetical protein [Crocosphaera sp. Alani8]
MTFTKQGQSYQRSTFITITPKAKLTYFGVPYIESNLKDTSLFLN